MVYAAHLIANPGRLHFARRRFGQRSECRLIVVLNSNGSPHSLHGVDQTDNVVCVPSFLM
jgi:hypothetical protein